MNVQTEVGQDLWRAVQRSYESEAWANAILDAIHYMGQVLRSKSDLQSDGPALVGQALGGKNPRLKLSRLETQSEQDQQAGIEQVMRGLYLGIRNPRSHERIEDVQADADAVIVFIDYLVRVLGHAKSAFSIDDMVTRVLDTAFVPNERYASLLIGETPSRQRLQLGIAVFRRKIGAEPGALGTFFPTLLGQLKQEESAELFATISAELRESDDDEALRATLILLPTEGWLLLNEAARLRTEHRIIRIMATGRFNSNTHKCISAGLPTWSRRFWPHFGLKAEAMATLTNMLSSGVAASEDYVFEYFFGNMESLGELPPHRLRTLFLVKLREGDARYRDALVQMGPWEGQWGPAVDKTLEEFQSKEPTPDDDDEIPF